MITTPQLLLFIAGLAGIATVVSMFAIHCAKRRDLRRFLLGLLVLWFAGSTLFAWYFLPGQPRPLAPMAFVSIVLLLLPAITYAIAISALVRNGATAIVVTAVSFAATGVAYLLYVATAVFVSCKVLHYDCL